jgi:hypothetical protein
MGEDRRVFERKTLRGPARIVLSGTPSMIVKLIDISLGGICVISDSNMAAKKSFQLEFNILVRKTSAMAGFRAAVVVTHVSFSHNDGGFRIGAQFMGLTDTQKQLIVQYMDARPPKTNTAEIPQPEEAIPEEANANVNN